MKKLLVLVGIGVGIFFYLKDNSISLNNLVTNALPTPNSSPTPNSPSNNSVRRNCVIKGNISHNNGRRIYHVPGQEDYENTRIDFTRGERYFCTEEEARRAGWVKAPR
jgi:hypothetical protein